jgi:hypothetical protein
MRFQQLLQRLPRLLSLMPNRSAPGASRLPTLDPTTHQRPDHLDLKAAFIHHLDWCVLFNEHLAMDSTQTQHITPLPDAHNCHLGQWLAEMHPSMADGDPIFLDLQHEHLRLHTMALQALSLARNNRMALASTLLNTDFERSRARVLTLLREMQKS